MRLLGMYVSSVSRLISDRASRATMPWKAVEWWSVIVRLFWARHVTRLRSWRVKRCWNTVRIFSSYLVQLSS